MYRQELCLQFFFGGLGAVQAAVWGGGATVLEKERCVKISVDKCSRMRISRRHLVVTLSALTPSQFYPFPSLAGKRAFGFQSWKATK